jgi:hypothetical protein
MARWSHINVRPPRSGRDVEKSHEITMMKAAAWKTISVVIAVVAAWAIASPASGARADAPQASAAAASAPAMPEPPFTADQIMASLNRALAWHRQARTVMQSLGAATASVFTRDDEQTALGVVRRAFETARAQAALLNRRDEISGATDEHRRRAAEIDAEVQRGIDAEQRELRRLQERLRAAPVREHPELQRQLVGAANRLALLDARREMSAKFEQLDQAARDAGADLEREIQALQDSVPELRPATAPPPAVAAATQTSGTMQLVHRLLTLQRSRGSLDDLAQSTGQLAHALDADAQTAHASLERISERLRVLSSDPTAEGLSLPDGQRRFQELLARAKLVGAILPPLRDELALAHRYGRDLAAWNQALGHDFKEALQGLAVGMVGVLIAVAAILGGAVLWRIAALRYVRDPYRQRLVMMARRVAVVVGLGLVLVFHFASELAALVTALGFAAAGIAFALQNVILAVAGYFSMMGAGDGIRVGDRVSLQGPFGYVHGDVLEIGLVRIRLRELAGDPLRPTGRVVVFSNSVVFTGSFFKHPSGPAPATAQRPPESLSA